MSAVLVACENATTWPEAVLVGVFMVTICVFAAWALWMAAKWAAK